VTSGTLTRYIDELSVTGLNSNPTIFDHGSRTVPSYEPRSARGSGGQVGRRLFRAAREDIPGLPTSLTIYDDECVDGRVSRRSPLLAKRASTLAAAKVCTPA